MVRIRHSSTAALVAVKPEVTLGEYKGVEVEKADAAVTAEDVDAELKRVTGAECKTADC